MADQSISLLIADDEERTCESLKKFFINNSKIINHVLTASDGVEALEKIIEHKVQYMIIDVQMPRKSGLQVMQEASRAGICPKAIVLSGHDKFEYVQDAMRSGATDYILKPCHPIEILEKMESMILVDQEMPVSASSETPKHSNRFVEIAAEFIEKNYRSDISLTKVAEDLGISATYLSSLFAQTKQCSFVDYVNKTRIEKACSYLYDTTLKTYEIAYKVGFNDEKYFAKVFKKLMGISPSQFRNNIEY